MTSRLRLVCLAFLLFCLAQLCFALAESRSVPQDSRVIAKSRVTKKENQARMSSITVKRSQKSGQSNATCASKKKAAKASSKKSSNNDSPIKKTKKPKSTARLNNTSASHEEASKEGQNDKVPSTNSTSKESKTKPEKEKTQSKSQSQSLNTGASGGSSSASPTNSSTKTSAKAKEKQKSDSKSGGKTKSLADTSANPTNSTKGGGYSDTTTNTSTSTPTGAGNGGIKGMSNGRPQISIGPYKPFKSMPTSPSRTKTCKATCSNLVSSVKECNNGGHVIVTGNCQLSGGIQLAGLNAIDIEIQGDITVNGGSGGANSLIKITGSDVNLYGKGSINGNGPSWWGKGKNANRPNLLNIRVKGGSMSQLRLVNPPMFFVTLTNSQNFVISDMKLDAISSGKTEAYNSDGIDPEDSDNIVIQNSVVHNDDDCVAIKAGSSNILVQGMECHNSHGVSIGSLNGGDKVSHVLVTNCKFFDGQAAARIKTKPGGGGAGGIVSDIVYQNIQVSGVKNAIEVNQCYENEGSCTSNPSSVKVDGVTFKDFTGDATAHLDSLKSVPKGAEKSAVGMIACGSQGSCAGISLSGINVKSADGSPGKLVCKNAQNSACTN